MKFQCEEISVLGDRSLRLRAANVVVVCTVADPIFRSIGDEPISSLDSFRGYSLLLVYFVQFAKKSVSVLHSSNLVLATLLIAS